MAKKNYAIEQRARYHKERVDNQKVSENKRYYSRNWLDGYTDSRAENNYRAVCSEISAKKGHMSKEHSIMLNGYKNGLKAKLSKR